MKSLLYSLIIVCLISFATVQSRAQGCVAVKNMSSCSINLGEEQTKGWQFSANYRYFRSYKHFVGSHEEKHRVEENTEVINNDNSLNLGATYAFNKRWSVALIVPYIWIDRSSLYEHLGNSPAQNPDHLRYHTQSAGFGDARVIGYYNAPMASDKANMILGFGFKAPTGNYRVKDFFHRWNQAQDAIILEERLVDQSIQLGDGGLGIVTEMDFAQKIAGNFLGYVNGMYMLNPRNTNGVKRSANPTTYPGPDGPVAITKSNEFSVPDQYMLRAGARFQGNGIQASLGGRFECIPSKDLIGKSEGFRRPGHIFSVEPAFYYSTGQHTFGFNLPVALSRNRTRSQIDIARGNNPTTGAPYHGDAAFADWLLSVTYACKLSE